MEKLQAVLAPSAKELEEKQAAVKEYDFIRFTFADMNGVLRGALAPGNVAAKFLKSGIGCFSALQAFGPTKTVLPKEARDRHFCNVQAIPDLSTLHAVTWADKYKVGQFMTETYWDPKTAQEACTRNIARRMLIKLDNMGLKLYSGVELEFVLVNQDTQLPVFSGNKFWSMLTQTEYETWFYDVASHMKKAGVCIELMHTESNPGQFEFTTQPKFGIETADSALILKQGIKEMAIQRGWQANFMAIPFLENLACGTHFNFSLWHKDSSNNAFWDESTENNISELGKHWIAGMIHHAKALTALCCNTVNCYRRLHKPWVPHFSNWGIEDRTAMLRVKNDSPAGTYIESRLPSSLCNPYLVMAATLAAGIDGVARRLSCPEPHDLPEAQELPHSLKEALYYLQEDHVMVEAMGGTFVEWFLQTKTEVDLNMIEGVCDDAEQFDLERKQYAYMM